MTPRELMQILAQWDLDEEFEIKLVYPPTIKREPRVVVVLSQKTDTIRLT